MKKIVVLLLCLAACLTMGAEKKKSLDKWAQEQRTPEFVDGVRVYRPVIADGKMSYGDYINYAPQVSNSLAFTRALVFTISQLDPEVESIETVDYDNHRFVCKREVTNEDETCVYAFTEAFQVEDGVLSFMSPEIMVKYKDKLVINKRVPFNKLNPEKKEAHFAFVEEFSLINSRFIASMVEAMNSLEVQPVKNWTAVKRGKAEKGMNTTEVLLTEGKPDNITDTSDKVKWMYGSYRIVIFDHGTVERVVNF